MTLLSIDYTEGQLHVLNQLLLPEKTVYENIETIQDGWNAINSMKVRGAPAIAIVGCLTLAVELNNRSFNSVNELHAFTKKSLSYLTSARPTAVNLGKASQELIDFFADLEKDSASADYIKLKLIERAESMLYKDIQDNKKLSENGADHILKNILMKESGLNILTHCNTGSLATAGYGTAIGVIRSLHKRSLLQRVYCTETRPYNQGARLTSYELVHDKIPATLIADSMVALLMKTHYISAVIVGADRVALNGDTANKIGTYQIAVLAKHHNIPFYVAAPVTSHCSKSSSGNDIVIEERSPDELAFINGVRIAAKGVSCWNPSFDVTDYSLITGGIITEIGVYSPIEFQRLKN